MLWKKCDAFIASHCDQVETELLKLKKDTKQINSHKKTQWQASQKNRENLKQILLYNSEAGRVGLIRSGRIGLTQRGPVLS